MIPLYTVLLPNNISCFILLPQNYPRAVLLHRLGSRFTLVISSEGCFTLVIHRDAEVVSIVIHSLIWILPLCETTLWLLQLRIVSKGIIVHHNFVILINSTYLQPCISPCIIYLERVKTSGIKIKKVTQTDGMSEFSRFCRSFTMKDFSCRRKSCEDGLRARNNRTLACIQTASMKS